MKLESIIKIIDDEIDKLGVDFLTPREIDQLLESKEMLDNSDSSTGKPFIGLLRAGLMPHAYKKNGRWRIPKSQVVVDSKTTQQNELVSDNNTIENTSHEQTQGIKYNKIGYYALGLFILIFLSLAIKSLIFKNKKSKNLSTENSVSPLESLSVVISDTINNGYAKNIYRSNGKIESEGNLINNRKEGLWKFYDSIGILRERVNYKNNLKNGLTKIYFTSGTIKESKTYKEDKLNGEFIRYFEDGNKSDVWVYKNDLKNGKYIGYDENLSIGKHYIKEKGYYKNDLENGEWRYYDFYYDIKSKTFGNELILNDIINYKDGIQNGKNITFDRQYGFVLIETNFENGLEHGIRKSYCPNGNDRGKLWIIEEYFKGNNVVDYPYQCNCLTY